jgi:hypothetical protein
MVTIISDIGPILRILPVKTQGSTWAAIAIIIGAIVFFYLFGHVVNDYRERDWV